MKRSIILSIATVFFLVTTNSVMAQKASSIKSASVTYMDGTTSMVGFVAYDSSYSTKRPLILIAPEWWGVTDYTKSRAKQLAALGYVAFVVDYYGDGTVATNPSDAIKYATPLYKNAQLAKSHFDAALATAKTYSDVDPTKIGAIGYCFGGAMILNTARLGEDIKGLVTFHGGLAGVPVDKNLFKAKVLVCHGGDDQFVTPAEVATFKKQMDSIGADYKFIVYPGATHAFSNPAATEIGKKFSMPIAYNEAADKGSWQAMQDFFDKIFK
jgi:dienelactone hydrolase